MHAESFVHVFAGEPVVQEHGGGQEKTDQSHFDALCTTNKPPELLQLSDGIHIPRFSPKFDWQEYSRVNEAIRKLQAMTESMWSQIVDHMTDEEYCITANSFGSAYNFSRGDVCYRIVRSWLNRGYCGLMPMDSPHYQFDTPVLGHKQLQKWCKERRNKSVNELQIEAAEWAISIITKESTRLKEMQDVAINAIEDRIAKIRKSPMPGSFFSPDTLLLYTKQTAEKIEQEFDDLEHTGAGNDKPNITGKDAIVPK